MKKAKYLLLLILMATVVTSCKDKNDDDDDGTEFISSLRAVWQDEYWDDGDEIGIYFTSTKFGDWDYFGDDYDQGPDCYFVFELGEIISRSGNEYRILIDGDWTDSGEDEEVVAVIEVDGNDMEIYDEEEDESYPYSKTSLSLSSMTPDCSDLQKASAAPSREKLDKIFKLLGVK